ncbi:MAG: hypothetical protein HOC71_11220 [Candidatus Latescibacteria bacterium]|nr:hypothetical protein [Candidatus Latescibacterota bacterium]
MNYSKLLQKHTKLLAVIQSDFPIEQRPFRETAELIGWTESEVIMTVHTLIKNGTIRTFGPVFDARKLGYVSTLVAAEVKNERITELAALMDDIDEITHNYLRDYNLNMWFTITAGSEDIMGNIFALIERFSGVSRILNLPALKVYKIKAVFGAAKTASLTPKESTEYQPLDDKEKHIIRRIQDGFPIVEKPFKLVAEQMGIDESVILDTVKYWLKTGVIRRFGARLNHHNAGYTANSMIAWKSGDIDKLGQTFAALPYVSHCYRRQSYSDWPFELYTMVHAKSESELDKLLSEMKLLAPKADMKAFNTIRELKKKAMKYFLKDDRWDTQK